jgi:hypothetical protein
LKYPSTALAEFHQVLTEREKAIIYDPATGILSRFPSLASRMLVVLEMQGEPSMSGRSPEVNALREQGWVDKSQRLEATRLGSVAILVYLSNFDVSQFVDQNMGAEFTVAFNGDDDQTMKSPPRAPDPAGERQLWQAFNHRILRLN